MTETHKMTIKGEPHLRSDRVEKWTFICKLFIILLLSTLLIGTGCTASKYRKSADEAADSIIKEKQKQLFGKETGINIERPSDTLRRRLMIEQNLPYSSNASLGTDKLEKIAHWPEKDYPAENKISSGDSITLESGKSLKLSLVQALQLAALNSSEYQTQKESVFQKALDLNLRRHDYGFSLDGTATYSNSTQKGGSGDSKTEMGMADLSLSKTLKNGTKIVTSAGVDIVNLLTSGFSSKTFHYDGSISIPLLRGAGKFVASEALTQAERDLIYSLYTFERYKSTFAVQVVQSYMNVLSQMDQVQNAAENYKNLITSYNRTSALAKSGRATAVEVNQALQQELNAETRWVIAKANYQNQLDNFKIMIGLPADADVELDRADLDSLTARASKAVANMTPTTASTPENLVEPGKENAGALEMEESQALKLAFENRLDLVVQDGKVYDAQRAVAIRADALRAELTLFGQAHFYGNEENKFDTHNGNYTGFLTLNLPFDRVSERNAYRSSYISLEKSVREYQTLEDNIKLSVRQALRTMAETREGLRIQTQAVTVAETGYKSASMFFESGRSELRDLLDAQSSLLTARNALTSAVISYRMAELQFQRDSGVLKIDDAGLLVEYESEENTNVKLQ
jgi:outer membrane protein TolC